MTRGVRSGSQHTYHERAIGVLEGGVRGKNRVVGLDDRAGEPRSGIDTEFELGLFAIICRKPLE